MKTWWYFMKKLILCSLCAVIGLSFSQAALGNPAMKITHAPLVCVVTDAPITISAQLEPASSVQEARVYFKAQGKPAFYFVHMQPSGGTTYMATLPAPIRSGEVIEYQLLGVDGSNTPSFSPVFYTLTRPAAECAQKPQVTAAGEPIVVYAEQPTPAAQGFASDPVRWQTSVASAPQYQLVSGQSAPQTAKSATQQTSNDAGSQGFQFDHKTMLLAGVGAGALVAAGVAFGMQNKEEEIDWTIDVANETDKITVEVLKNPTIQTRCGTFVTNQLYVTNKHTTSITVGTISYEVILTEDDPSGSCQPGRTGTFAPDWATVIAPGARVLVREWVNEVNPCSECPYVVADCEWTSQYIVHTSIGQAAVETTFRSQGNLCSGASSKLSGACSPIQADIEP